MCRRSWPASLLLLLCFVACRPAAAQTLPARAPACEDGTPIPDMAAALQTVSERFRENYQKLHTWRGTFEIVSKSDWSGGGVEVVQQIAGDAADLTGQTSVEMVRNYSGEFAVDFDQDRLFTTHELSAPTTLVSGNGGSVSEMPDRLAERSIATREKYIHMDAEFIHSAPFMGLEDWRVKEGRVAFRDPLDKAAGEEFGTLTDPRRFFWTQGDMETYGDYLATWIPRLNSPDTPQTIKRLFSGKKVTNGETTMYCLTIADHQQFLIDSRVGYNVVLFRQFEPETTRVLSTRQIDYIQQDGIFIPSSVRMIAYHADGRVRIDYQWTLKDSTANEPIADEVFSYQQLGLKDGERVIDRVENVAYVFADGKLTEPKNFDITVPNPPRLDRPPDGEAAESAIWRYRLLTINLIALGLFFSYVALKLWQGRKPGGG